MNANERARNNHSVMNLDEKTKTASIQDPRDESNPRQITYDAVFTPETPQQRIYEISTFPILEAVFNGYNGTVFAYGQTGCGKTHTMMGVIASDTEKGIVPRTFNHMLSVIDSQKENKQF
jgi:Tfp pilus assembly pilus retraction ATPase PilT